MTEPQDETELIEETRWVRLRELAEIDPQDRAVEQR